MCLEEVAAAEKPKGSPSKNLLKHKKTGRIAMAERSFLDPVSPIFLQLLGLCPAPPHCVRWSRQGGGQVHLWSLSGLSSPPIEMNKIDLCLLAAENPGEVHCWRKAAGDASKARHGQLDGGETIFQALINTCVL